MQKRELLVLSVGGGINTECCTLAGVGCHNSTLYTAGGTHQVGLGDSGPKANQRAKCNAIKLYEAKSGLWITCSFLPPMKDSFWASKADLAAQSPQLVWQMHPDCLLV